jgi:hypothetical protein
MLDARLLITEFSALNDYGIRDQDGQRSDWIELHNAGDAIAQLDGLFLTDDPERLNKWRIPPTTLEPGAYEVIFASGKDLTDTAQPLHTNFRLAAAGEYLALVDRDGRTVLSEYADFPPQLGDYSFGVPQEIVTDAVLSTGAEASVLIPTDDSLGLRWIAPDFDDSQWTKGPTGVGFGASAGFAEVVATDVKLDMIRARNSSAYVRVPFQAEDIGLYSVLELRMKYDDGFVAYLNGVEVARRNAPDEPAYNSAATEAHPNVDAVVFEAIDLFDRRSLLVEGTNVLALHGMNLRFSDADFLLVPEITVRLGGALQPAARHYFPHPTPGQPNGTGTPLVVSEIAHSPSLLDADQPLNVIATVSGEFESAESMQLRYRVMYGPEVELPMFDDGLHADGGAGDGVYGATIPAGVADAGQMIRYYVVVQQASGETSRWPNFRDPLDSAEYQGTVVRNPPSETSKLPVMQIFMQDPAGATTREGTRGSFFYEGEFYDNVRIDLHGNLTATFPRKSRDVDLNRDHNMRISDEFPLVNDINLLTNYTDPSKMRSTLVYEAFGWAGAGGHFSFPVRTELNGRFEAIYDLVEDGDDRFLERIGRDRHGALYNMSGPLDSLTGAEKRSGDRADLSDLQSLVDGLNQQGESLKQFLFDHVNLPALANYLATLVITSYGDCCTKNYYVYQDTHGTGEWEALPWDVNIALGAFSDTFDEMRTDRPLFTGSDNRLFLSLYQDSDFRQMYLRRLRTLMDEIYGPPGSEGRFEQRIDELFQVIAPDGPADEARLAQIDSRRGKAWEYYVDVLRTKFVDGRRNFLYNTQTVSAGGPIPAAQPTRIELAFGHIEGSPVSGNQDEEYLQLTNPNEFAVDISGWSLEGAVTMQFQGGTVIPARGTLYLSPNVNAFRARDTGPSGSQAMFVQGPYTDRLGSHGGTLSIVDPSGHVAASQSFEADTTPAERFLRITEIMYNPQGLPGSGFEAGDFEYLELHNISGSVPIDLTNVLLDGGIRFDFTTSNVRHLGPHQFVLVVNNRVAFEARYGTELPVAGRFEGQLSNGGELIRLSEGGTTILEFTYQDDWYPVTDGDGPSLVVINDLAATDRWNAPTIWRPSPLVDGTPGTGDGRVPGDSNGDGRFDLSDLLHVFSFGKYEDDLASSSTFEEGDWNGDGEFNSFDIVFAFQLGNFLHDALASQSD